MEEPTFLSEQAARVEAELGVMNTGIKGRDLCAENMFAYGTRVTFWRLMRLLADREIQVTINGTALALERHPDATRAWRSGA